MSEALTLNGVSLASLAYMLPDISGIMSTPARRGENVTVPGRHGAIRNRNKRFDPGELVLPLWILGCEEDGSIPGGSTAAEEFFKRRDELLRLLYSDPLILEYTRPDGLAVQASVEMAADPVDFTRVAAQPIGKIAVALSVTGAFWSDSATVTQTVTGTSGVVQALTAFEGATAPMADLVLTFGPCNNPSLTAGNRYVTYNEVISSGRQLVINTSNWTVSPGTGSAWSPDPRLVEFGPGPTWFELSPTAESVTFTHTGGGSATCSIAGHRKYLSP